MRKLAITSLTLAAAAIAGMAGLVTAAIVDSGSGFVVAVVVAMGLLVIGLIEWTHRRRNDLPVTATAADRVQDQDTRRALDELRAARTGTGHSAVSHALRSV